MDQLMEPPRRPPRKPNLTYSQVELEPEYLALLRMTWYGPDQRPRHVEEFAVYDGSASGGELVVRAALEQATVQGYDVHVSCELDPEVFGLRQC